MEGIDKPKHLKNLSQRGLTDSKANRSTHISVADLEGVRVDCLTPPPPLRKIWENVKNVHVVLMEFNPIQEILAVFRGFLATAKHVHVCIPTSLCCF